MRILACKIRNTLDNSWFWVCVGLVVSATLTAAILEHRRAREIIVNEYTPRCPIGYIDWKLEEFLPTAKFEQDGESMLVFERSVTTGCRPRAGVKTLNPAAETVHKTEIRGIFNLTGGYIVTSSPK